MGDGNYIPSGDPYARLVPLFESSYIQKQNDVIQHYILTQNQERCHFYFLTGSVFLLDESTRCIEYKTYRNNKKWNNDNNYMSRNLVSTVL